MTSSSIGKRMINVNCPIEVPPEVETAIIGDLKFLHETWETVPIFFVDEQLMDVIVPPEHRRTINPECLSEKLMMNIQNDERKWREMGQERRRRWDDDVLERDPLFSELMEVLEDWRAYERSTREGRGTTGLLERMRATITEILGDVDKNISECMVDQGTVVHDGVFFPDVQELLSRIQHVVEPSMLDKFQSMLNSAPTIQRGVIFISPDRLSRLIQNIATQRDLNPADTFHVVLAAVVYHELAHAYMHRPQQHPRKTTLAFKVMEESLANAIALHLIQTSQSLPLSWPRGIVSAWMKNQPFEYRGFDVLSRLVRTIDLKTMMNAWKKRHFHALPFLIDDELTTRITNFLEQPPLILTSKPNQNAAVWTQHIIDARETKLMSFLSKNGALFWALNLIYLVNVRDFSLRYGFPLPRDPIRKYYHLVREYLIHWQRYSRGKDPREFHGFLNAWNRLKRRFFIAPDLHYHVIANTLGEENLWYLLGLYLMGSILLESNPHLDAMIP